MLREETVEPATLGLLKKMVLLPELKQFRLVGGTALSLIYGHRKSIDLDFFTDQPFEKEFLIDALENNFGQVVSTNARFKNIYQCIIQGVKVDFVCVKDQFSTPAKIINDIPFPDIGDLIALKLNAIKGRGVKKDFWDVAALLKTYNIAQLFNFYQNRYPWDDSLALERSIGYFIDAERDNDPFSLDEMTWAKVKKVISKSLKDYYKQKNIN